MNHKKWLSKKWLGLIILGFLGLGMVLGCSQLLPAPDSAPLVLGYSSWPGWWPWAIAVEENLFAKNGVTVELKWYDSYVQSMQDMAAGKLDANCQTLNDTVTFAPNADAGEVVVLVNDNSDGNDKIIVDKNIQHIWSLRQKQVALEVGIVNDFLLTLALESVGLSRTDVKLVNLDNAAAATAFKNGKVDAVSTYSPYSQVAMERANSHELVSSKNFPGAIPDLLVVSQSLIDQHPQQVQALVNTWFDVLKFMEAEPEKAQAIMSKRANLPPAELPTYMSGTRLFSLEDNIKAFTPGNDMTHLDFASETVSRFIIRNNLADKAAGANGILNDTFVKAYGS